MFILENSNLNNRENCQVSYIIYDYLILNCYKNTNSTFSKTDVMV